MFNMSRCEGLDLASGSDCLLEGEGHESLGLAKRPTRKVEQGVV